MLRLSGRAHTIRARIPNVAIFDNAQTASQWLHVMVNEVCNDNLHCNPHEVYPRGLSSQRAQLTRR
jgi:hypothetical protein